MAEVVWQARRVSDGVLVDVTGDTAGTPAGAPTPNPLEAGGGGGAIAVTDGVTTVDPATSILFPSGTLTDEGGGVAGIAVHTRQINGAIAYNTALIITDGAPVGDVIPAGSFVFDARAFISTPFAGTPSMFLSMAIAPANDLLNWLVMRQYESIEAVGSFPGLLVRDGATVAATVPQAIYCGEDARLIVYLEGDVSGDIDAGAADVMALISVPL